MIDWRINGLPIYAAIYAGQTVLDTSTGKIWYGDSVSASWIQITAKGRIDLINADEADVTGGATNVTAKTYSLLANTYSRIIVEAEWECDGASGLAYDVTFVLKIDGVNTDDTAHPTVGAVVGGITSLDGTLKGSKVQTTAVTVTVSVTVNSGTVTWNVRSLRVYGVV